MKKISQNFAVFLLPFFVVALSVNLLQAQTSKAEFEKAIVADFCDTFAKASPHITKENMIAEMGMMVLPLFKKYSTQIEKEWNLSTSNTNDYRSIGEKIGQLATFNCPAFQDYIKANLKDLQSKQSDDEAKTFSGRLTQIEGKPFVYLLAQNSMGRTDKFYWLEFFPGAEKLTSSANAYLNKTVVISYKEMEVYQALEKEYKTIKIITKIAF